MLRTVQEIPKLDDRDGVVYRSSLNGIVEEADSGAHDGRLDPKVPIVDRANLKPIHTLLQFIQEVPVGLGESISGLPEKGESFPVTAGTPLT